MSDPLIRQTVFGVTCFVCEKPIVVYRIEHGDLIGHGIEDPDMRFYRGRYDERNHKDFDEWMLRLHGETVA